MLREERGVLPVTLDGDIDAFWNERPAVARVGLAAALYHPTTGYSLPDAVRTAELLADWYDRVELDAYSLLRRHSVERWNATGFYRMLNRMLFHAAQPALRYRVLERFYSLPEALIARFYAGQLTWIDRARLLVGKPPVPLHAARRAVRTSSASRAAAAGTS